MWMLWPGKLFSSKAETFHCLLELIFKMLCVVGAAVIIGIGHVHIRIADILIPGLLSLRSGNLGHVYRDFAEPVEFIPGKKKHPSVPSVVPSPAGMAAGQLEELHSGATVYEAIGAYNLEKHNEIITIVDKSEYQKLMNFINRKDPKAFITVYTVSDMRYQPKVWEKK